MIVPIPGRGGHLYLHIYVGSEHYFWFKIPVKYFWGYEEIVDFFFFFFWGGGGGGGHYKKWTSGSFLYI